jgi:hypothetical protein
MPDLTELAIAAAAADPVISRQVEDIIAELRVRGIELKRLTNLGAATDLGLGNESAALVANLIEWRLQLEGASP